MPELRQRQPRTPNKAFLAFVRLRACCVCGAAPPVHAAHIRMASVVHGKRECGKGEKPSDLFATPLCARCHLIDQHGGSEREFWQRVGKDPFAIAARLFAIFETEHGPQPHPLDVVAGRRFPSRQRKRTPKKAVRSKAASVFRPKARPPKRKWPKQSFPKGRTLRSKR